MVTQVRVVTPADIGQTIKLGLLENGKYDVDLSALDLPEQITLSDLELREDNRLIATLSDDTYVGVDLTPLLSSVEDVKLVDLSLDGTRLVASLSDTDQIGVDLAGILPTVTAEIFLKAAVREGNEIVFTVGEQGNTTNDTELRVSVADLLPVQTDGTTITGDGTAASPLKAVTAPRDVQLMNADGSQTIGYLYSTEV